MVVKEKVKKTRVARCDGSVDTITRRIVKENGLPRKSVILVRPNGRKMRCDATIKAFRKLWEN